MRCYWRLLNISLKDHITNEDIAREMEVAIGEMRNIWPLSSNENYGGLTSGLPDMILQAQWKERKRLEIRWIGSV